MLRSAKDLQGYTLHATDGDIETVRTFYFDDEEWCIRYLVVDTGSWLAGKRVLLSPVALADPLLSTQQLPVNLTREQVRNSPEFDAAEPVNRDYEHKLYDYYGRPTYWS